MQMLKAKYIAGFNEVAVRQIIDRCHSAINISKRLEFDV